MPWSSVKMKTILGLSFTVVSPLLDFLPLTSFPSQLGALRPEQAGSKGAGGDVAAADDTEKQLIHALSS